MRHRRPSRRQCSAWFFLGALACFSAVRAGAQSSAFTSTFLARWNLTHGKYLVDIGQYLEALEAFETAIETSGAVEIRTDALLEKASLLALFLDAPEDSIRVYDDLLAHYSDSSAAETAQFRAGMVLFDGGEYKRAGAYFERYLEHYPQGASRGSAEFLLQQSRSKLGALPQATQKAPGPTPSKPLEATRDALPPSTSLVRVRIAKGHSAVRIESDGSLALTPVLATGSSVDVSARSGLVSINGQPGVREVNISATQALRIRASGGPRRYRGALKITADGGTLQIVNRVGVEEYLYGVVTKESGASWPGEALKTQAIASRTYALYQVQHRQDRSYDMVDDEGSQVYGGVDGETAAARRAVDATRGTILAYRGRPIYALFTSNAGWHTGDPKFIFDQPLPYLTAVPDPYSPGEQMGRWTRTYSADEVRRALSEVLGTRLGPIRAIRPVVSCPSGRIVRVAIVDDQGAHEMRTRTTLARALKLPEILLDVRHEGDRFVFAGGGFGHGVGLSQWGAKDMADKGFSAKEILAFYYRGADLTEVAR
jgi:stage II sporulation protein D